MKRPPGLWDHAASTIGRLHGGDFKLRLLCWRLRCGKHFHNRNGGYDQYDLTAEVLHVFLGSQNPLGALESMFSRHPLKIRRCLLMLMH